MRIVFKARYFLIQHKALRKQQYLFPWDHLQRLYAKEGENKDSRKNKDHHHTDSALDNPLRQRSSAKRGALRAMYLRTKSQSSIIHLNQLSELSRTLLTSTIMNSHANAVCLVPSFLTVDFHDLFIAAVCRVTPWWKHQLRRRTKIKHLPRY